jgi:cyanophycinase-like exopeptidase
VRRQLVIMGSGETTPGMRGVHREILSGLPEHPECRLMDSPFAFQENADELVERIAGYFAESVGQQVARVTLPADADALTLERALADIRVADWLFAGPGSPSYARRCWTGTPVPEALAGVVAPGRHSALLFASAAAVTLGDWALPVYEIYKVGEDPRWEPGLGLMSQILGWRCAVVPHYDNREGGTHDTRFCYVGGRRLARIEPELDGFILGVDEHTALLIDLDRRVASVRGRGGVTLRVAGQEHVLPAGTRITLDEIESVVAGMGRRTAVDGDSARGPGAPANGSERPSGSRAASHDAPDAGADPGSAPVGEVDPGSLAHVVLEALPGDAARARAAVVALVGRAEQASAGAGRALAEPLVEALVAVRSEARAAGDWAASDRLRDALAATGVEVRDTREGSTWRWT